MPSIQDARAARRRKILARGSDRLAFIVGERPAIPPAPPPKARASAPPEKEEDAAEPLPRAPPPAAALRNASDCERAEARGAEVVESAEVRPAAEPRAAENCRARAVREETDEKASTPERKGGGGRFATAWTWERLGRSIDVTQNYRAWGALSLALLLLAQNVLFCENFGGWALPWPIAVLVATDVSLCVGFLTLGAAAGGPRRPSAAADAADAGPDDEKLARIASTFGRVGRFLDAGTVLLKSSRALFLDCSIYVVALTSGFSLTRNWKSPFCAAG